MIIITKPFGQLSNRVWLFANLMAHAIEHNYTLYNPAFQAYSAYFDKTDNNDFGKYPIYVKFSKYTFWHKAIYKIIRVIQNFQNQLGWSKSLLCTTYSIHYNNLKTPFFDVNQSCFSQVAKKKIVLLEGWPLRSAELLEKHGDIVRNFFTPKDIFVEKAQTYIKNIKKKNRPIIGVHIRRGDYQTFRNGMWCYNNSQYYHIMQTINYLFEQNYHQHCDFIIVSNSTIDLNDFKNLSVSWANEQDIVEQTILSMCDYIVGPPSTFSMWASFFGKKPLYIIENVAHNITLKDFFVCKNVVDTVFWNP
jgi:Glycosyl transferase family 11